MIEIIQSIRHKVNKVFFLIFYKSSFNRFGKHSTLTFPFKVNGAKFISIFKKVHISEGAWLLAMKVKKKPRIIIGNGSYIGRFSHIVSISKVEICSNVLISDKVYISDNLHAYKDIMKPIKDQEIYEKQSVVIGEHTWIGENVSVIGASVGKHCVIGANSVVTSNIPDYCVAVGIPARIIKKYNNTNGKWEKI